MKKILLNTLWALFACISTNAATIVVDGSLGAITTNTTWTNNNTYLLVGEVVIKNATLTIEPGTIIKADFNVLSRLLITRTAKIYAQGTPEQPIVFTSNRPIGSRKRGDWGGISIAGNAPLNTFDGNGNSILGLFECGTAPDWNYGGSNADDSSGVISYVRIEFAGYSCGQNSELNSLSLGGVGRKTKIDHVMVSYALDDAYEIWGGTVNLNHIVSFSTRDDDFDTDNGWSGKAQYGLLVRVDSVSDEGDRGNVFESDNDAPGSFLRPYTSGVISNFTCVGPAQTPSSTIATTYGWGARIRRNSAQSIFNSIFMGFDVGVEFNGNGTKNKFNNDTIEFKNNLVGGSKKRNGEASFDSLVLINPAYGNTTYTGNANDVVQLAAPFNYPNFDFRPQASSAALSGYSYTSAKLAGLEQPAYRGAVGTGTYDNWWRCWGEFDPQTQDYSTNPINYSYAASINANGTLVCPNGGTASVELEVTSPASGLTYNWSNGSSTQKINVTAPGTYTVTVSSARGCTKVLSRTVSAFATTAPSISPATPSFCTGESATLSSSAANGYLWSNGATTQTISVTAGGQYSVTITDGNGCSVASSSINVTQNTPVVPVITALGNTSFCTGGSLQIAVNNPSSFTTFSWSNNQSFDTITVATSGSYKVTTTDNNGCTAVSNTITTDVSNAPKPTITSNGAETFCAGDSVILTSSVAETYSWSTGETTRSIVVRAGGSYTVLVTNTDQCDGVGTSNPKVITVQTKPTANFNISQQGNVVTVSNTTNGGTTYNWTFGNGQSSTQQNPSPITYNQNGSFTITLTATNGNCTDVVSKQVTIVGVSIAEVTTSNLNNVRIYPNPNTGFVTLEVSTNENTELNVSALDVAGREVLSFTKEIFSGTNEVAFQTTELANGVYFLNIKTGSESKLVRMIVNKN